MKKRIRIENWYLMDERILIGTCYEHPDWPDGTIISIHKPRYINSTVYALGKRLILNPKDELIVAKTRHKEISVGSKVTFEDCFHGWIKIKETPAYDWHVKDFIINKVWYINECDKPKEGIV